MELHPAKSAGSIDKRQNFFIFDIIVLAQAIFKTTRGKKNLDGTVPKFKRIQSEPDGSRIFYRTTVPSIWPCGSSVGTNNSLRFSRPNGARLISRQCLFGSVNVIFEISGAAFNAASPIW